VLYGKSNSLSEIPASLQTLIAAAASAISPGESSKAESPALFFNSSKWPGFARSLCPSPKIQASGIGQIREVLLDDWATCKSLAESHSPKFSAATAGSLDHTNSGRQVFDPSSQEGRIYPPIVRPRQQQSKMSDCKSAGLRFAGSKSALPTVLTPA
jgi:hypothetical protein